MRAVIFDLDGVLVRTDQAHDKAWRALAGRLGIPFDGRGAAAWRLPGWRRWTSCWRAAAAASPRRRRKPSPRRRTSATAPSSPK